MGLVVECNVNNAVVPGETLKILRRVVEQDLGSDVKVEGIAGFSEVVACQALIQSLVLRVNRFDFDDWILKVLHVIAGHQFAVFVPVHDCSFTLRSSLNPSGTYHSTLGGGFPETLQLNFIAASTLVSMELRGSRNTGGVPIYTSKSCGNCGKTFHFHNDLSEALEHPSRLCAYLEITFR